MAASVKIRKQKKEINKISILLVSTLISFFIFFVVLTVCSSYIMNNHTEKPILRLFVIIASGFSSLFAGFISSYSIKTKRLVYGMINALFVMICEFLVLLCFNNVALTWQVYLMIPVAIITSFIGCVLGINLKK